MQVRFAVGIIVLGLLDRSRGELSYNSADIDDGRCTYPQPVPIMSSNLVILSPLVTSYVPFASKSLYRFHYQALSGQVAQTEGDILALKPRVYPFSPKGLFPDGAIITVSGFGSWDNYFSYQLFPTLSSNPLLNVTGTVVRGSSAKTVNDLGGKLVFTGIWNDATALTLWGCFQGRQSFHILSKNPTLTDTQWATNQQLLINLGFNSTNFQQMIY